MSKILIDRELLEEALSYTSCPSWSPSLTEEIKAALATPDAEEIIHSADLIAVVRDADRYRWLMQDDLRHGFVFRRAYGAWDGSGKLSDFIDSEMAKEAK